MRIDDITVKNINDIKDIISNSNIVRVSMCNNNKPYMVPLNYGYEIIDNQLVLYCFCIKEGKKLDILRENPNVFIEIDTNISLKDINNSQNPNEYFTIMSDAKVQFIDIIYDKIYGLSKILDHSISLNHIIRNQEINNINLLKIKCENITAKLCTV